MKALIALTLLLTFNAFSAEILLKSFRYDNDLSYEPTFMINKDLGRAWVNVEEVDDSDNEDTYYNDHFVKVDGLKLVGSDIVYKDTTCASIYTRGWGIFRREVIGMTKSCKFKQERVTESYDDGYYMRRRKLVKVYLVIEEI